MERYYVPMRYISTRGGSEPKKFSEILLEGLAPDGGLYVPETYPTVSAAELEAMRKMSYPEIAFAVLSRFIDDIPAEDLRKMIQETYSAEVFGTPEVTPLKKLEDGLYILGLSEGPTLAFKDVALQLLGRLFEYTLAKKGDTLNIVGATSGDTGSAAEYAVRGRKGIRIFMLSPENRMSAFQRKQMYSLQESNIFNIVVRGTFDECQDLVKALQEDAEFKKKYKLGAVNSINWARIAAQTVYYFYSFSRLDAKEVSYAVPSGNFGDILAGYIAKRMGLPVHKLIVATNENNVLEEFFQTGVYRPRKDVAVTSSPSMDISKASNFERYVFDLVGRDAARLKELWSDLKTKGQFDISTSTEFSNVGEEFAAGSSSHADRLETIKSIFEKYGVVIDPHTADGVKVGLAHRDQGVPLVCLETAQPAKFAETIREAIGKEPRVPENLKGLLDAKERFEILDADEIALKGYVESHVH